MKLRTNPTQKNTYAFTMIEIVVFIAVLGILAGIAGVRFNNRPTKLVLSVQTLVSQLEYAKLTAMNSNVLIGYQFDTRNHNFTGTVISNPPLTKSPFPYEPYTFQLDTDQITVNAPQKTVLFNPDGLVVNKNGKVINRQIQIQLRAGNLRQTVYIEKETGRIHL